MINFLETKVNDIKSERDLMIDWNSRVHNLAQLKEEDRKEAIQYIGEDHVYRFSVEGILIENGDKGSFDSMIDIMANSVEEAEQAANDYFVATYIDIIEYYSNKARTCENCSCSFKMMNLYTQEEANEENRLNAEWEETLSELELCMTL